MVNACSDMTSKTLDLTIKRSHLFWSLWGLFHPQLRFAEINFVDEKSFDWLFLTSAPYFSSPLLRTPTKWSIDLIHHYHNHRRHHYHCHHRHHLDNQSVCSIYLSSYLFNLMETGVTAQCGSNWPAVVDDFARWSEFWIFCNKCTFDFWVEC